MLQTVLFVNTFVQKLPEKGRNAVEKPAQVHSKIGYTDAPRILFLKERVKGSET